MMPHCTRGVGFGRMDGNPFHAVLLYSCPVMSDFLSPDYTVDARHLHCPEPVMLLHKAVREVLDGQLIEMLATDPSTSRDVPKFCYFLGHELLVQSQEGTLYRYVIRKITKE